MNNNMAKDTEFKEINNTKDTESIKLDSNGDEIIWELKHKKSIGFFYSWFARCVFFFGGIYYIIIGTQKYLSRDDNGLLISVILLVLAILWFFCKSIIDIQDTECKKDFNKK